MIRNWKTATIGGAIVFAIMMTAGCGGVLGIGDDTTHGSLSDRAGASKDQLMTQGQQLIMQGRSMQDTANSLPDGQSQDGVSKQDMLTKAKGLISQGDAMIVKAKAM